MNNLAATYPCVSVVARGLVSPQLLEFARPDEVRFLDRDGENIVVKEPPATSPEWEETMREYEQSLGSVWLSGSLGGIPGP